eukprot:6094702-Pleurochrysis_carterae.AAC.1
MTAKFPASFLPSRCDTRLCQYRTFLLTEARTDAEHAIPVVSTARYPAPSIGGKLETSVEYTRNGNVGCKRKFQSLSLC